MGTSAITFSASEVSAYYASRVPALNQRGKQWRGRCPIHCGKHYSFSVDPKSGLWFCFSKCGRGGDLITLEQELQGGDFLFSRRSVYGIVGRSLPPDSRRSCTPAERRRFARRRESARNLAESAGRWHRATVATLELRKRNEIPFSTAWIVACRDLGNAERLNPQEVLDGYARAAEAEPKETARRIKWAEGDERECAQITAITVRLIAAAEDARDAAGCD